MQNIITAFKLLFLGIYIELTRSILHFILNSKLPLSSPKTIFFSELCNYASTKFLSIEKNYAKSNENFDICY